MVVRKPASPGQDRAGQGSKAFNRRVLLADCDREALTVPVSVYRIQLQRVDVHRCMVKLVS